MGFTRIVLQLILLLSISGCLGENISGSCSDQTICALRDSEVTMKCFYPDISIKTVFWFSFKKKAKWRNETQPEDLALDSDYTQRANTKKTRSRSTLTIRKLRERDSGEYHFMIITEQGQKHLSSTVVNLTVTDLWVKMTTDHEQQTVTLTCSTSCSLTSKPKNYYWYKNGVKIQKKDSKNLQRLVLSSKASCLDAGSYSCSVSDTEEIWSSELHLQVNSSTASDGQTVTLVCSSTCTLPNNPTYIWYKNRQPVTNKLRDNKLYLKSTSSEDLLQYSCALEGPEQSSVLKLVTMGVVVFLALILITGALLMCSVIRRKRGAERDSDVQTPDPADHTYTALNPKYRTSDYDTLQHITDSPSDTYTALNPETMCLDYDTLTVVKASSS
ncbi:hypothetical protein MHYP_G00300260 [Metynnis hypsauchen]